MPDAVSQGSRIHYSDHGQGEPAFLFLPGWCGSCAVFDQLAAACALGRRTLALDWRGHGLSDRPAGDFGVDALVEDALAVLAASGVTRVVPVALSHAGWVAIELRRRLGERVPQLVLLDWIVLEPPPPFLGVLQALQDPAQWSQARDQLFALWLHGLEIPALSRYLHDDMGSYGSAMWARAGREISAAYARAGSPSQALAELTPAVPVLHLYAQPDDPAYLSAQQALAAAHPWFHVVKLEAGSHFPMLEVPEAMAAQMESFVAQPASPSPASP